MGIEKKSIWADHGSIATCVDDFVNLHNSDCKTSGWASKSATLVADIGLTAFFISQMYICTIPLGCKQLVTLIFGLHTPTPRSPRPVG